MNKCPRFREGEVVALNSHAVRSGVQGRAASLYGRIIRLLPNGQLRVLRDGIKQAGTYSPIWWRPLTRAERAARGTRSVVGSAR